MVNGDFEAAGAVNGGLRLRNFGVDQAAECTAEENQRFTLVVQGGTLDYANGQLFCGNLLASADVQVLSLPSFVSGSLKVGNVLELSGIDFEEAQRELLDESETLCSAVVENNAPSAVVDASGGITFTATGSAVEVRCSLPSNLMIVTNLTRNRRSACWRPTYLRLRVCASSDSRTSRARAR
jgi:choice-of-anchor A domain-containing protein